MIIRWPFSHPPPPFLSLVSCLNFPTHALTQPPKLIFWGLFYLAADTAFDTPGDYFRRKEIIPLVFTGKKGQNVWVGERPEITKQ